MGSWVQLANGKYRSAASLVNEEIRQRENAKNYQTRAVNNSVNRDFILSDLKNSQDCAIIYTQDKIDVGVLINICNKFRVYCVYSENDKCWKLKCANNNPVLAYVYYRLKQYHNLLDWLGQFGSPITIHQSKLRKSMEFAKNIPHVWDSNKKSWLFTNAEFFINQISNI